jgi:hypothetical protein
MFYNHIEDKAPAFELPRFRNSKNVDAEHRALENQEWTQTRSAFRRQT